MLTHKDITLGTVQFGLDYGISNQKGRPSQEKVNDILSYAKSVGITSLDTASSYGDSEQVLGLSNLLNDFKIITKTPHFTEPIISSESLEKLETYFKKSINFLMTDIHGLLVHNGDDLLKKGAEKIFDKLQSFKKEGHLKKIGVSVYNPDQCQKIINNYEVDIVQLPLNIFDQRFLNTGMLDNLKSKAIEIHVRSIFLQGVSLMSELPAKLQELRSKHELFASRCQESKVSQLVASLGFVASLDQVDSMVLGVNAVEELKEIISAFEHIKKFSGMNFEEFSHNGRVINPTNW